MGTAVEESKIVTVASAVAGVAVMLAMLLLHFFGDGIVAGRPVAMMVMRQDDGRKQHNACEYHEILYELYLPAHLSLSFGAKI